MRKEIFVIPIILLMVFTFTGLDMFGRIRLLEPVDAGDELEMYVNVRNPLDMNFEDLSVRAFFFDMGDIATTSEFEIEDYDTRGFRLIMPIPKNTMPGGQYVKVVVSGDEIYDSEYFYFNVR